MAIRVCFDYVFIGCQNLDLVNIELFGGDETWKDVKFSWKLYKVGLEVRKKTLILNLQKIKIKISCPICMDSIKLEISTFCGHIFYEVCILGVINGQNICLICRVKLKLLKMSIIFTCNLTLNEKLLKMGVPRVAMVVVYINLCVYMLYFFCFALICIS